MTPWSHEVVQNSPGEFLLLNQRPVTCFGLTSQGKPSSRYGIGNQIQLTVRAANATEATPGGRGRLRPG